MQMSYFVGFHGRNDANELKYARPKPLPRGAERPALWSPLARLQN